MARKRKIFIVTQKSKKVVEYHHMRKEIIDELAWAQSPISDEDLVITVLNDLNYDFKEITTAFQARKSSISYEELFDKLTNFESILKHEKQLPSHIFPPPICPKRAVKW